MNGRCRWLSVMAVLVCACVLLAGAQTTAAAPGRAAFTVLFYNVENLFDCTHDSLKQDQEYVEGGKRRWSSRRYFAKLERIAKVVWAAGNCQPPDLVGLCEVENHRCMEDLTRRSILKEAGYRYLMTESPDQRGIDVALLYRPSSFRCLGSEALRIPPSAPGYRPTRDILHVWGKVLTGDTLDVFVCHFPSRLGGAVRSLPFRQWVAHRLRRAADSVASVRRVPQLLVMGDMNDGPSSRVLKVLTDGPGPDGLIDLMVGQPKGTYRYRGKWETIDHLLVNRRLTGRRASLRLDPDSVRALDFPFLLVEDDTYGGERPCRTYQGWRYEGGFSDHLPVRAVFDLILKQTDNHDSE